MSAELSVPVIWVEDEGRQHAGRLDLYADRLHLDGGPRDARHTLDVPLAEIASVRIGREDDDRINGRPAIVVELGAGGTLSFVGFDRPGTQLELLHRLEALL